MASAPKTPQHCREEDPPASRLSSSRRTPRNSGFLIRRIGAVLAGREGGVTTAAAVGVILAFGLAIEFIAQLFQTIGAYTLKPIIAPFLTFSSAAIIFLFSYRRLKKSQQQDALTRIHHLIKILPPFERRSDKRRKNQPSGGGESLKTDSIIWAPNEFAWRKGPNGDEEAAFDTLVKESNLLVTQTSWHHFLNSHVRPEEEKHDTSVNGLSTGEAVTVTFLVSEEVTQRANWHAYRAAVERILEDTPCEFEVRLPNDPNEVDKTRDAVSDVIKKEKSRSQNRERILVDVTSGQPHQRIAATHAAVLLNVHIGLETGFNRPENERRWHHLPFNM